MGELLQIGMPELDEIAATMPPDWRYRWRTTHTADGWSADVQAGYADERWRTTGACPRWGGTGATEREALAEAVDSAVHYWTLGRSGLRA
ncbi:MAG: hypothetical protein K2W86_16155 [Sphingomonas sp.]|uniref:hypothetical protein n=1 Tax=Sphingomonas sp. TaxID=28214 RepID=UPI0035A907CB|nr:hypothetical protein [Sphingomonas sp.]